jgi:hypothetical protein
VNDSGNVSLGDRMISAGLPMAGQCVTLRLDGPLAHVVSAGALVRTLACPVPPEDRARLRGARPGSAQPPRLPEPLIVARRVSVRGYWLRPSAVTAVMTRRASDIRTRCRPAHSYVLRHAIGMSCN